MTVKELKEKIWYLDDNIKVGACGYFGEYLECFNAELETVFKDSNSNEKEVIFSITIESKGNEPE